MYCEGGGELKCPGESYQKNGLHVYEAFPQNVTLFCDLGALPFDMDLKDQYMAEEYLRNHVKWHKSCHLKFAHSKLRCVQEEIASVAA